MRHPFLQPPPSCVKATLDGIDWYFEEFSYLVLGVAIDIKQGRGGAFVFWKRLNGPQYVFGKLSGLRGLGCAAVIALALSDEAVGSFLPRVSRSQCFRTISHNQLGNA